MSMIWRSLRLKLRCPSFFILYAAKAAVCGKNSIPADSCQELSISRTINKQNSEYALDCGAANPGCRRLSAGAWSFYIFLRFSFRASTKCGAGAFACQPNMFYRRELPHWHPDVDEATFLFVTWRLDGDRKSTRLNSSHRCISYAVFCL